MPVTSPTPTSVLAPAVPATARAPESLAVLAATVEARLDELLGHEQARWAAVDGDLAGPLRSLRRLVRAGGKRLRPAFCHWGYVAAGGSPGTAGYEDVLRAGLGFELLHAFALVHDDVMDDAPARRGEATAHIEHGARHRAAGWRGEARRYGESVAILVGDLAHVLADRAMAGQAPEVLAVWRELQTELMMGQYLDVLGTARGDRSLRQASLVMQLKSGRYTIERPLQVGAAIAAAQPDGCAVDTEVWLALDGYGRPLGEAFQLRDDLLGAFGSPAVTGKPVGDDLREGKPTALLAHATAAAGPAQRAVLDRVGAPDLTDADVEHIQAVIEGTGARRAVEATVDTLTEAALRAIDNPAVAPEARRALTDLAVFIAARHH